MFAQLKKLLEGNDEALGILGEIEKTQSELTQTVNSLEVKFSEARDGRDKVKSQLRFVKDKLGVEELNEDTLAKALKQKGDDAELLNLKAQLEKTAKEKEEIESSYKGKLSNYVMKTELSKTGLAQDAYNSEMYQILEGLVLTGATYQDDGKITFKNEDGSTVYSDKGKPMSLEDKVALIKADPRYAPMFKGGTTSGTGSGNKTGAPSAAKLDLNAQKQDRVSTIKERYGL